MRTTKAALLIFSIFLISGCAGSPGTATEVPATTPLKTKTPRPSQTPSKTPKSTRTPTITRTPAPTSTPTPEIVLPEMTWDAFGHQMVFVPRGEYLIGASSSRADLAEDLAEDLGIQFREQFTEPDNAFPEQGLADEEPQHEVGIWRFYIDKLEVTNYAYRSCVEAGFCDPPDDNTSWTREEYYGNPAYDDYPVIYVSWEDARSYCEWRGARLPTEAEWEIAASGPEALAYPWGNEFDGSLVNFCDRDCRFDNPNPDFDDGYRDTSPGGNYPGGASPFGALDMAGNVAEWVNDWYSPDYYQNSPGYDPEGPESGEYRVVRGGSFSDNGFFVRAAERDYLAPGDASFDVGFRCASTELAEELYLERYIVREKENQKNRLESIEQTIEDYAQSLYSYESNDQDDITLGTLYCEVGDELVEETYSDCQTFMELRDRNCMTLPHSVRSAKSGGAYEKNCQLLARLDEISVPEVSYFDLDNRTWWKELPAEIIPISGEPYGGDQREQAELERERLVTGKTLGEIKFERVAEFDEFYWELGFLGVFYSYDVYETEAREVVCGSVADQFFFYPRMLADFDGDGIAELLISGYRRRVEYGCAYGMLGKSNYQSGGSFRFLLNKDEPYKKVEFEPYP